jgi:hypothetical protein
MGDPIASDLNPIASPFGAIISEFFPQRREENRIVLSTAREKYFLDPSRARDDGL